MSSAVLASAARARVVAVIVAHNGSRWLPRLIAALGESSVGPDEIVAVDTGSTDSSAELLRDALGPDRVIEAAHDVGFGDAVRQGLDVADQLRPQGRRRAVTPDSAEQWIWLLHDDCAPDPDALESLLAETRAADVAAVGCRVRAWPRARRLLEVGVTISGTGRREANVEPGEYDQGQHDEPRDVLAVGSAGMLVRRSVWDALGGFDPRFPLFRDDVDFGWRLAASGYRVRVAPRAVLFHAEAARNGVRAIDCAPRRPHRVDRAAALLVVLANCRALAFPFVYLRLLLGSAVRAAGYLLGKLPSAAWDETLAAATALGRLDRVVAARRRRRQARSGKRASARRLLPPWWSPYAWGFESILDRIGRSPRESAPRDSVPAPTPATGGPSAEDALESGPVAEDAQPLPSSESLWGRVRRHPLVCLELGLIVLSLIAGRGLWGGGFLQGGALLPSPDGAGVWWRLLVSNRHNVGLGATGGVAPYVEMLAIPGMILLGKASLVVDLVMLFAAPIAAGSAWALAASLGLRTSSRFWAAAAYGCLPVVTGAVVSGHLGTVVASLALPWIARGALGFLGPVGARGHGVDRGHWAAAWRVALPLTIAAAFAPICWPIVAVLSVVGGIALAVTGRARRVVALLVSLAAPVVALSPWSWRLLEHPGLCRFEAGLTVSSSHALLHSPWLAAFARTGAPGAGPWWLTAGLSLAAVLSLLRPDTRGRVAAAWVAIAACLVAAAVVWRQSVALPQGQGSGLAWVGTPVLAAAGAAVFACAIAGDRVLSSIGARTFGWRQPIAVVGVLVGLSAPVLALGWWTTQAPHGALGRGPAMRLPVYMTEAMQSRGSRVLVLDTSTGRGSQPVVRYHVLAGDGERLGEDSVLPAHGSPAVRDLVSRALSAGDVAAQVSGVEGLARLGVGYVAVPAPQDLSVVSQLDTAPGLIPTSSVQATLSGWQVAGARTPTRFAQAPADPVRVLVVVLDGLAWLALAVLAGPGARRPIGTGSRSSDPLAAGLPEPASAR